MKRHKVTRKTKTGKTVTYWRGEGSSSPEKNSPGAELKKRIAASPSLSERAMLRKSGPEGIHTLINTRGYHEDASIDTMTRKNNKAVSRNSRRKYKEAVMSEMQLKQKAAKAAAKRKKSSK